jgi:RNA polymerase sigma-70 factor (ECF subfamily)
MVVHEAVMRVSEPADLTQQEREDEPAIVAAARVDRAAFAPLYRRYADPVYRFCYRRLGSADAAADATAQIFTKALAGLAGFRGASFRAWLFAIARNVVVDELRRGRPVLPLDEALAIVDETPGGAPEERALAREQRRRLRSALAQLPDDQRQIVELRLAGLKGPEIAVVMGRTHAAIKSSQFRAYARLRQILADEATAEETTDDA